jgi:hypothetical protein
MIMTTIAEIKEEANRDATLSAHRVSILYGDHGKRKTTTACSMVKENGLLLTADDSWKVLLNDRHKEVFSRIGKVIRLEGLDQLEHIDFSGYDTIIWDTFSATVDFYIDLLYDAASWTKNYREKIESKHPILKSVEIMSAMDYRVTRDIFRPYMNEFFKHKAHIIFTSQWNEPMKGLSPDMTRKPAVPNATFKIIATKADLIANIRPDTKSFVADMTENSIAYLGKSRIQGLEGKMPLDTFVNKYKEIVFDSRKG